MKYATLQALQKEGRRFPIYFLQAKEEGERKYFVSELIETVKSLTKQKNFSLTTINKNNFNPASFEEQITSFSLFQENHCIHLEDVDKFSSDALAFLNQLLEKIAPSIILIFSAASLNSATHFYKSIDRLGAILHFAEEKPWEKKRLLSEWLIQASLQRGKKLSPLVSQKIVECTGLDRQFLKNEIEKVICLIGERGEITFEDFKQVGTIIPQQTLWQLGEEIFQRSHSAALNTLSMLLLEGISPFSLVAHLRSQFVQAQEILVYHAFGGKERVQSHLPYLKGALLQKKIDLLIAYGQMSIEEGLVTIYDAELKLRNENISLDFIIERLLIDLMT